MAKLDRSGDIVLSTGARIPATYGTVGINEHLRPMYGHDGSVDVIGWHRDGMKYVLMTHAERRELSEYAISLWRKFAELDDEHFLNRDD